MLFMIIVKASAHSEANGLPSESLREAMSQYNKALVSAGIRVMAKGLHPTAEAVRFTFNEEGKEAIMSHGPFEKPTDQVAGFILIEVASKEEALYWAKKMPDPQGKGQGQIELRQVFE